MPITVATVAVLLLMWSNGNSSVVVCETFEKLDKLDFVPWYNHISVVPLLVECALYRYSKYPFVVLIIVLLRNVCCSAFLHGQNVSHTQNFN